MFRRTSKNSPNNLDPFFEEYRRKDRKRLISLVLSLTVSLIAIGGIFFSDEISSLSFSLFGGGASEPTKPWSADNVEYTEAENESKESWETADYSDPIAVNTTSESVDDAANSEITEPVLEETSFEEPPVAEEVALPETSPGVSRGETATPTPDVPISSNTIHKMADEMPSYPGGNRAMKRYLDKNMDSSIITALSGSKQSKVWLQFVVETNGDISSVQIVQGINEQANREAVRLVQEMPEWEPGKIGGERVRVYYTISVNFSK